MGSIELIRYSDILKEAFFDLFYYKLYSDGYVPIDNTINIDKTSLINNKLVDSKIKSILKKSQNELNNLDDIEFTQLLKKIIDDTEKLNGESQLALVKVFQLVKGKKFVEFLKILLVDLRTEFGRLFSIKNSIDNESPLNWKFEDFQFDYKNGYLQRSNVQLNFINNFDDFIA
ncbi:TPA: hypothetical protein ACGPF1_000823, partial [Streptococcus suis]